MTRLQEMSLDYHFSVEQEVGSSAYSFFGFNGSSPLKLQFFSKKGVEEEERKKMHSH